MLLHKRLHILLHTIIPGIIFNIIIYNLGMCNTLPINHVALNITQNNLPFLNYNNQKTTKLFTRDDYMFYKSYIPPRSINNLYTYTYNNQNLIFPKKLKIQFNNNSIDILHLFCKKQKIHQKKSSLMQLGIHNFLSKQTISFGLGERYVPNRNTYFFGYNAFCNCPISNNIHQPYSINLGIEYWFYNTLLAWNNYYNLNNFYYFKKLLRKSDTYNNLKSSYQLYLQTQFPYFTKFTGKIKLERLLYAKNHQEFFNQKNNNYCLSLSVDYKPIPMLSFDINKIFMDKKHSNTIYKILIHYQLGVPIAQQIKNYKNKNIDKSALNNIDIIIPTFIPTIIQYHKPIMTNDHTNIQISRNTEQIIGQPREIKIIKIKNTHKNIQWNIQSLRKQGGNIVQILNNIYAIHLPDHSITKKDNICISYNYNDMKRISSKQNEQKIHILVNNNMLLTTSRNAQTNDNYSIYDNQDYYINDTCNTTKNTLVFDKTSKDQINNTLPVILNNTEQDNYNAILTTSYSSDIIADDDFVFPIPPPLPVSYSREQSPSQVLTLKTSTEMSHDDTSLIMYSSLPSPIHDDHQILDSDDTKNIIETHNTSSPIDSIKESIKKTNSDDKNLLYRLSTHKQDKFSSVGTADYINKLEETIKQRKKSKQFSSMERIFYKLHITQSSSSINEDRATTDDSDDSFY